MKTYRAKRALLISMAALLVCCASCKDKREEKDVIIQTNGINRLDAENITRLSFDMPEDNNITADDNNGTVKLNSDGTVYSYGSNGKTLGMGEVILKGTDSTAYYIIDNDDIIYDGVRFKNLNKALDACKAPYSKENMINFIVKTFNPPHYIIECTYENDEEDTTDMNSVPVDSSLELEFTNYASIVNKYGGKRAVWRINLYSADNMRLRASLVGNDKFVLFRGDKNIAEIDMEALAYKSPRFMDIPEYLLTENTTESKETQTSEIEETTLSSSERAELYSDTDSLEDFKDTICELAKSLSE